MFTVDVHSHLTSVQNRILPDESDPDAGREYSDEEGTAVWIESMDAAGISLAITFDPDNDRTKAFLAAHPERFRGLVGLDARGGKRAIAVLEQYLDEDAFVGVKCSPSPQFSWDGRGYALNDRSAWEFYEYCEGRRVPILFHTGTIFRDRRQPGANSVANARPILLDDVARAFPNLPIVIGHCGRPLWEETLCLANLDNVFIDLTWSQLPIELYERSIDVALKGFGARRTMFGSDTTSDVPHRCKLLLDETLRLLEARKVDQASIDRICGATAREVFGL